MRVLTHRHRRQRTPGAVAAGLSLLGLLVLLALMLRQHSRVLKATEASEPSASDRSLFGGSVEQAAAAGGGRQQLPHQATAQQQLRPGQQADALASIRGVPLAFVSFANGAFHDMLLNWVLSVQRLGLPFVVGALDARMAAECAARGWPHLDVGALVNGQETAFRTNFSTFRNMGATKVQLVLTMLEELHVQTVMVSDSDTSWVRDPSEYLARFPTADFFISTDCLSAAVEEAWQPRHNQPRCGHIPGNGWGRAFNTGIFAARNCPAARRLLEQWRDLLLDPKHATEERASVAGTTVTLGITDQLAMHHLIEEGVGLMEAAPDNPRLLWLRNHTLRLHTLPVLRFPSGHVAFVQRLPQRHGVEPYVVHATFQRFPARLHSIGKRGRFREFGLWHLDEESPGYYAAPGARYLTYDNNVRQVVDQVAAQRYKDGGMPVLYKHMIAIAYQVAQFRDALAAATMLNRTLVLPNSWCWCDMDWVPDVLEHCKIKGTDTQLPFECPADFVFHIPLMDAKGVPYRVPNFLQRPQVPDAVRRSQAEVPILPAKPAAAGGAGAVLWPRISEAELLQALVPVQHVAVLALRGMQPGLLEGFSSVQQAQAFDAMFQDTTNDEFYWCCAAVGNSLWSSFPYARPRPFASGYMPWEAPILQAPQWCDAIMDQRNAGYRMFANHPCSFLRNATAAAIAATIS